MGLATILAVATALSLLNSPTTAQIATPPSPAPAPAPHIANLTALLSYAGPFHTFLNYLVQTRVIETFQNQANNTDNGITVFAPKDSAFASLKTPSLSNLTADQLKSLLLFHALPDYYSLSDFRNLSASNPIGTFAGGQYTVNVTDSSGLIRVSSGWSNPRIASSVVSTHPVAVYELDHVLLPEAIFGAPPPPAPAPAPAPAPDTTITPTDHESPAPKSSDSSNDNSSSSIGAGVVTYLVLAVGLILVM